MRCCTVPYFCCVDSHQGGKASRLIFIILILLLCSPFTLGSSTTASSPTWRRCVQDCPANSPPTPQTAGICGGVITDSSTQLYEDASTCCSARLSYLDPLLCQTRSEPGGVEEGTFRLYPSFNTGTCSEINFVYSSTVATPLTSPICCNSASFRLKTKQSLITSRTPSFVPLATPVNYSARPHGCPNCTLSRLGASRRAAQRDWHSVRFKLFVIGLKFFCAPSLMCS